MNRFISMIVVGAALTAAGCLHLETAIKLNEDGSAVVTERLGFSRRLLEMDAGGDGGPVLEGLLAREAAEKRAPHMGVGVTLASHEIRDGESGCRECVSVYHVADLEGFVYVSPFVGGRGYRAQRLKFRIEPNVKWSGFNFYELPPGCLYVHFSAQSYPAAAEKKKPGAPAPAPRSKDSPRDLQAYRDLTPMFADLLDDFRVRVTFEAYAPISAASGLVARGIEVGVRHVDLINVSGRHDMDRYGYRFLRNEEIMSEMLQGRLDGPFWQSHLYSELRPGQPDLRAIISRMRHNSTLPLVSQGNGGSLTLKPSRALFRKYLEGKTLDWTGTKHEGLKARGKKPADFNEVGWKPVPMDTRDQGDLCLPDCPWCKAKGEKP